MKPLRPRYAKIDRTVAELLKKHRVTDPAVDVEKIARKEGATVKFERFNSEISGLLLRRGTSATIAVDETQAKTRQRFTIAHELGHLMLHDGEELRVDRTFRLNLRSPRSETAEDVEEVEANAFAAMLLMPRPFLLSDLEDHSIDLDDEGEIKTLAKRYEVSAWSMTIRLINLHLIDKSKD